MNITTVRLTAIAGALLLGVGLLIGFLPVHAAGVSCGSAFVKTDSAFVVDLAKAVRADRLGTDLDNPVGTQAACSDARSGRLVPAVVFLVLGGGGLLFAVVAGSAVKRAPRPGPMGPYGPAGPVPPYGPPCAGPHR